MSEIAEIIDTLENKIQKLLTKVKGLEAKNQELQHQLKYAASNINKQSETVETLKKDYESLKITSALLGSEDYKRDTKLKINSLIREIDYCIAQLAD